MLRFKQHKEADDKFLVGFFEAWERYLQEIQNMQDVPDLGPEVLESMTPDQRQRLQELRDRLAEPERD